MTLRTEFLSAVNGKGSPDLLHQVITSDSTTKTIVEAINYVDALKNKKIVHGDIAVVDRSSLKSRAAGGSEFKLFNIIDTHRKEVVVIDKIYDLPPFVKKTLAMELADKKGPVFILTGEADAMKKFLSENDSIAERLPSPVHIDEDYSRKPAAKPAAPK